MTSRLLSQGPPSTSSAAEQKKQSIDFYQYLLGTWKRNLEWREFGGTFALMKTTNTLCKIEEFYKMEDEPGQRWIKWNFGRSLNDYTYNYTMKFVQLPRSPDLHIEWSYSGALCTGKFIASKKVAILNFLSQNSMITVTYRILDENTMAVCIVEVDDKQTPSIQYGNMFRINPDLYTPGASTS